MVCGTDYYYYSGDVAQPKQSSGGNWEESGTGDRGVQDATNVAVSDHQCSLLTKSSKGMDTNLCRVPPS